MEPTFSEMLDNLSHVRNDGSFRDEPTRAEAVLECIGQTLELALKRLSEKFDPV